MPKVLPTKTYAAQADVVLDATNAKLFNWPNEAANDEFLLACNKWCIILIICIISILQNNPK